MKPVTYVVSLVGEDVSKPHKHFTDRQAAREHALKFEEDPAIGHVDTYQMFGYVGATAAIEARERGEGTLIERQPSTSEVRQRIANAGGLANYLGLTKRAQPIKRRI